MKDKFGVSRQTVPSIMPDLLDGAYPGKADRTLAAMLKMGKSDIAALERAHAGE